MSVLRSGAMALMGGIALAFASVGIAEQPEIHTLSSDAGESTYDQLPLLLTQSVGSGLGGAEESFDLPADEASWNDYDSAVSLSSLNSPANDGAAPNELDAWSSDLPDDVMQQSVVEAISGSLPGSQERDWRLLPDGLLYHSYLAGPQEPRISAILFGDDNGGYFWDATLGGRVGFLRYGTDDAKNPQGWQWDLEGAVMTRLDLLNSEDVESMDFRFGTLITWSEGPWAMKFGYFHLSSHVGDEYMIRNPSFERINYVTESLIYGVSHQPIEPVRVYGEAAIAVKFSGGAKRMQYQTGVEWSSPPRKRNAMAPFAAANFGFREATEFHMATTLQAGWQYQGPKSDRRLRFGLQYGDGPTSQFEFFQKNEEYLGWGIWFDY
ncbi:DUF1207 domain-containing protein [Aporhodopirellula aestuarii]|uniref:DUF1207 domain-containing protein n=1 Tax=Aporhodopirellula aestuarii TaxID=2950107 RepID=A0ABT0U5I8_9BACT|nr:DUF1207 domain-containing protein [Aporhodopirellula aestuarii]MCM2372179.1 DUF1207 domain-containing protein [Aporhodopirellula aestuarii]